MGALIEFLFSNIYLVIIVLAVLSSIIGRLGRGGGRMPDFGGGTDGGRQLRREAPGGPYRSGETPGGPRRFGDMPGGPEPTRPPDMPRRPEMPRYPEHPETGGGRAPFPREWMPERSLDAPGREVVADVRPGRADTQAPYVPPAASRPAPAAPSDSAADLSDARPAAVTRIAPDQPMEHASGRPADGPGEMRKAIIWAEILGPPRALKPFGRRRVGR